MGGSIQNPGNIVTGTLGIVFGYFFLSIATAGVLLLMDLMECFLHALRLHW